MSNQSEATLRALLETSKGVLDGLPHFYDCINFDQSALDADAILWMNEAPSRLAEVIAAIDRQKGAKP